MSEVPSTAEKTHIVCTPDTRGGKPRIAGTRICVQDIYQWHEVEGKSADQIVDGFPQITMADVYAALPISGITAIRFLKTLSVKTAWPKK